MDQNTRELKNKNWIWYQLLVGALTGFCVSPLNTIVDKSIIQHANGRVHLWTGVWNGLKSFFHTPRIFLGTFEFRWVFLVYSSTYITSNYSDHFRPIESIDPSINKLILTFIVNSGVGLLKDKALTQAFGGQKRKFPLLSLGFLFLRDIAAIAAAFTIPPILGHWISSNTGMSEKKGYTIAQLTSPLLIQFIGTPLHLIGLDIYNRPHEDAAGRYKYIRPIFWNTLSLRMMRFLPAYGIGGIVNTDLRQYFRDHYGKN